MQATELVFDRLKAHAKRREVRYQDGVQFHVCLETHSVHQVGHQMTVRVVSQVLPQEVQIEVGLQRSVEVEGHATAAPTVPNHAPSPIVKTPLPYCQCSRATSLDARRLGSVPQFVPDVGQIRERVVQPPADVAQARLQEHIHGRVDARRGPGRCWTLYWRKREPGGADWLIDRR